MKRLNLLKIYFMIFILPIALIALSTYFYSQKKKVQYNLDKRNFEHRTPEKFEDQHRFYKENERLGRLINYNNNIGFALLLAGLIIGIIAFRS